MKVRSPFQWSVSLAIVSGATAAAMTSCGNNASGGFDDDASMSSTSSGSSGSNSSGSSGGDDATGPSSSGASSGMSSGSSGASSGGRDAAGASDGHYVPTCGRPCDLLSNTCCLPADGGYDAAYCLPDTTQNCGTNVATFHCGGVTDCPHGEVCCGSYDLTALTAETVCQRPSCSLAQFCETSAECPAGVKCTAQLCALGAHVYLCGVESAAPCNCIAD